MPYLCYNFKSHCNREFQFTKEPFSLCNKKATCNIILLEKYPLPDPPNAVFHKKSQVKRNLILSISILAACLLCVFGLRWRGQVTVYTTINLDVNPSISICLNHSGDILSVTGLNEDGKKIVAKLSNIKEQKLDQIIAATIKQMVTDGYFTSEDENAVLISVDTNNSEEATALMDQISSQISTEMDQQALSGNIISQQMDDDADVKKLAKDLHISSGKATFIQSMTHENQKLSKKDLADMKISEIVATAKTEGMDVTKFQHLMKIKNVPPPKEDNQPHKDTTEVHASPTEEEAISHKPQENRKQTVVETSDKETPSIAVTHRPSDRQQQKHQTRIPIQDVLHLPTRKSLYTRFQLLRLPTQDTGMMTFQIAMEDIQWSV